ncbi:MAG: hypothetical protein AB1439_03065 [candidate division FCPU426 bacterium]
MLGRWKRLVCCLPCFLAIGCASLNPALQNPQVEVTGLSLDWASPETSSYVVELKIRNMNPMTLLFSRLDIALTAGAKTSRQSQTTRLPMVPAYGERTLSAELRLPAETSAATGPQEFTVSGQLTSASQWQQAPLPFKQRFNRLAPKLPVVALVKVRTLKTRERQEVLLSIGNPNDFPILLRRMRAEISQAGKARSLKPAVSELTVAAGQTASLSLAVDGPALSPKLKGSTVVSGEMEFASSGGRLLVPLPRSPP